MRLHAVIDIGTNSVKLLVAEVEGNNVRPILEQAEQTRLGKGFYHEHRLQPAAMQHTADVVASFTERARESGAQSIRLIATSAVRDALNQDELLDAIRSRTHLEVQVISGSQEAAWAVHGVQTDPRFTDAELIVIDVGGGSTQFALTHSISSEPVHHSFRIGAVRLFERFHIHDPPASSQLTEMRGYLQEFLRDQVEPFLKEIDLRSALLVGTGGTASLLAGITRGLVVFDRDKIESEPIAFSEVQKLVGQIWSLPLKERKAIPGLPPHRADVILTGAVIFEQIMNKFGVQLLQVSTRGLRFAAVLDPVS